MRRAEFFNLVNREIENEGYYFTGFCFLVIAMFSWVILSNIMVIAVFSWILLSNIMLDDRPDVIFSHLDGKCIKVENVNPNDHYSCDNLPEKYNYYYGSYE